MAGAEYPVRDGTGEWGAYRAGTIEALAHVGKVTGEEEVQLADGRWVPILSVPELRQAVTGEEAPAEAAPPPAAPPAAAAAPAAPVAEPPPAQPAAAAPTVAQPAAAPATPVASVTPGTTYEVIKADGAMLPAMPLPLVIANIRDGNIGPDDLVAKAGSPWVPARDLPELSPGFNAGVRDGATPEVTGSIPAMQTPAAATPPAVDSSPSSPVAASPPTPEAAQPPPVAAPAEPAAAAPAPGAVAEAPAEPKSTPASRRDLATTPFGVVLGQLLRERATGRLVVDGDPQLSALLKDGHPIAAELAGDSDRTQTSDFMLALGGEAAGPTVATAARSAAAVTDVLTAFRRTSGAWRFDPAPADQPPQFWIHPWELQRAGYALQGWDEQVAGLTGEWNDAVISLPGANALGTMPLADGERVVLGLVDGQRTFEAIVQGAAAHGLEAAGARRTLLVAKNLGLAALAGMPDELTTGALSGEALFRAGRDPSWVLEQLRALDDGAVLGLAADASEAEVQAAYVRLVDCLKDFAGNAEVRSQVLQRINVAHRTMSDAAKRRAADAAAPAPAAAPPPAASPAQPPAPAAAPPVAPAAPAAAPDASAGDGEDDLEAAMAAAMASGALAGGGSSAPSAPAVGADGRSITPARPDTRELMLEQNFGEAQALIEKSKWADAQRILRRLVQVAPLDGRFHGWLGYVAYMADRKAKNAAKKAADEIGQAMRLRPEDPELPYLLGTVYNDAGETARAEKAFQQVLKLDPRHEGALGELKGVTKAKRKRRKKQSGPEGEPKELMVMGGFFLLVFGLCFVFANVIGHDETLQDPHWRGFGEKEYFYYHDNWWFWARRILLLGAALIGLKIILKDDKIESVRPVEFTFLGFVYGGGYGFLSAFIAGRMWPNDQDGALILPSVGLMIPMLIFHAVSEEFFFRRFLTRIIQRVIPQAMAGAALSAVLFGFYYMTYTAFYWGLMPWNSEFPAYSMPMQMLSTAMTWGLPLGLLFYWSRSIGPPLTANLMFGISYIMISYARATGKL